MWRWLPLVLLLGAAPAEPRPAPQLISLAELDATIALDIRYATSDNFVGAVVEGYRAPRCLLTAPAARALVAVQRDLAARGLGLVVFDCYRPQRAVDHFARWASDAADTTRKGAYYPNVPKSELLARGYIAVRSSHSRGSTADVGLVRLEDGQPLDMGTPFDFFDARSHSEASGLSEEQRTHRLLLRHHMQARGFRDYPKEWWHFTLAAEPYPETYFDIVVE